MAHVRERLSLRGDRVLLRPFRLGELERVRAGVGAPRTRAWQESQRRMIRNSGRLTRGFLYLAIEARGRLVGGIDARTRPKFMLPEGVFELGVELYSPDDRGLGLGSEALALLVTYLFGEAEARRIQAATSVDNEAMRRVLEKAGFAEEGVLREYVAGADYVMCSITRGTAE